jgi:hypothetical protein
MSPPSRIRSVALATAAAASLALGACGDGDDTTASTSSTETTTTTAANGGDASALREQFNRALLGVLTEAQDLTKSQAECAIDQLDDSLSDADIQSAVQSASSGGGVPQDVLDAAFDAGQACADQ